MLTISNVGDIIASIALSRDVDRESFHSERIDKVLEETQELCRDFSFIGSRLGALTEACADRLLDPDHVGQIRPAVRVRDRPVGSYVCISNRTALAQPRCNLPPPRTYHIAIARGHSPAKSLPEKNNRGPHSTKS